MGRGIAVRVPALILVLAGLAPLTAEAGYRFEDGVYLGSARLMADWADTLDRARRQQPLIDACLQHLDACERPLRGLHTLVHRARLLERDRQLHLVNRYLNKRRYRRDRARQVYSLLAGEDVRLPNRWSTLVEFLRRGGDCADYATSKYQLLRAMGVPAEDLRVVVVYDRGTRQHHAVLAVRSADGGALLLDSDDRIYRSRPFGYNFIYALNETSIWDHELDAEAWSQRLQLEEPT